MISYCLERAKSGRSKCTGKCKEVISNGQWRFGSSRDGMTYYRCLPCITPKQMANVADVKGSISTFVHGLKEIAEGDKVLLEKFLTAVADGDAATKQALLTELQNGTIPPPTASKLKIKVPSDLDPRSPEAQAVYSHQADLRGPFLPTSTRSMKDEPICFPEQPLNTEPYGFSFLTPASMMPPPPPVSASSSSQLEAYLPVAPPVVQATPLVMSAVRAVAALGTPNRNQLHDYLREQLGADYRKGGVTGALGRCVAKGLLSTVYAKDSQDTHYQCEDLGLNLMALHDAKQAQTEQYEGKGSAPSAPVGCTKKNKKQKSVPTVEHSRIERALAQPMHCQDQTIGGTQDCPRGVFAVQGSKGNVYEVQFGILMKKSGMELVTKCSCPDSRTHARTYYCKHRIFVAIRVLQVPMSEDQPLSASVIHAALAIRMSSALPVPSLPAAASDGTTALPIPDGTYHSYPGSPTHSLSGLPLPGAPDLLHLPLSDFSFFDHIAMPPVSLPNALGDLNIAKGPSALPSSDSPPSPVFDALELNPSANITFAPVAVLTTPNRKAAAIA